MQLTDAELKQFYDVVIIGGGPAGLTAAMYLARACYRVVVVEKAESGGLISVVAEIVNYPGSTSVPGAELIRQMREHAAHFGAEFLQAEATALRDTDEDIKRVVTTAGELRCYAVLLATGAKPHRLGFTGEDSYRGRGVAYNAAIDGEFFTGKEIFVIGAGTTAARESVFLTKYATHVTVLVPQADFSCDLGFWEAALAHPQITIHKDVAVEGVTGDSLLRSISWHIRSTGERTVFSPESGDTFGIFILLGYDPETSLVHGLAELDTLNFILTDRKQRTSVAGLYAAGDICSYAFRQTVTAAASGAVAAADIVHFVFRMQNRAGLVPMQAAKRAYLHKMVDASPDESVDEKKSLFSPEMLAQLNNVFMMMEETLILKLYPDSSKVSDELSSYMNSLAGLAPRLRLETDEADDSGSEPLRPYVQVVYADGRQTGITFHGMPGGNEFNSFILGIYNASCPGQKVSEEAMEKIRAIDHEVHISIFVTLTCGLCPDLVTAAQRIATLSEYVTTDVYDLNHFPALREKYNIMSVPCYLINDGALMFGYKNVEQLLELL